MPPDAQRLAHARILVGQLRLLLGNMRSSVVSAILLVILMVWALSNDDNGHMLIAWGVWMIAAKIYAAYDARRLLASELSLESARSLVWKLVIAHGINGAAWGALAWLTLDTASTTASVLVLAVLAGVTGSMMSMLSPLLPVFLSFCIMLLIVLASKLFLMGDPEDYTLAAACLLYLVSIVGQGRSSARAARTAIELRFENLNLIERLSVEAEHAQTAHREAERANLAKSKFLAAASHDLRQPIHAQGLFLEVLARSELSAVQREVLASACAASETSAEMLNTLLDFSRIEAGVVEPQIRPFHLQPLLNKIENELAPLADFKGLIYRSRETHAAALSDPALVGLILRNLVSNAIRYTERGGVLVACRTRADAILVEVWDTGIGIAPSQQQEIFREFHQLGNTERDHRKGLGLGLAIADGLARALGHGLSLASRPRRGSVFRLSLPIARVAVASDDMELTPGEAQPLEVRVLVIDDDEAVRAGMLQLLRNWGCACEAAESIEEALVLARAQRPDLVISDYRLREQRTGAQAIAALRAEFGAQLPALLITGDTAPERLREARASGVPLLHKPVSPALLRRRLVEVLSDSKSAAPRDVVPTVVD